MNAPTTTITVNGITITCEVALAPSIVAELCKTPATAPTVPSPAPAKTKTSKPRKTTVKAPAPARKLTPEVARGVQWWDSFKSAHTTVTLKRDTVQVKVDRGYATEWHDKLRAAGFTWSKKGFWWASLDSKKRQAVADRHIANDAATAGMTKEEKRAYWRERNSARHAA